MNPPPHSIVTLDFDPNIVELPLDSILPIREITRLDHSFGKYKSILASIKAIGLVEPLIVSPNRVGRNARPLLDGHMRLKALKELGHTSAPCLISRLEDAFTYNDKVSRISIIQEHRMITKAIACGISEEEIARALNVDIKRITQGKSLLTSLHPEAVQILKDKPISDRALHVFKRVRALRQIDMANLMVAQNNYALSYAQALLVGTPPDQLVKPKKNRKVKGLSAKEISRIQKEAGTVTKRFGILKEKYGDNTLQLTAIRRYVRRLLENTKIKRFLEQRHPDLHEELAELATMDSL